MAGQTAAENPTPHYQEVIVGERSYACRQAREADFPLLYKLSRQVVLDKKCKEKPFGETEHPELEDFIELAESGVCVIISASSSPSVDVAAFGAITPSLYHRNPNPLYADLTVCVVKQDEIHTVADYASLFRAMQRIAHNMGYYACLVDTFLVNINAVAAARQLGFRPACFIPYSGLRNGKMSQSIVLFKAKDENVELPAPDGPEAQSLPEARMKSITRRPGITNFPMKVRFSSGLEATLDHLKPSLMKEVLHLLSSASQRGQGYCPGEVIDEETYLTVANGEDCGHAILALDDDGHVLAYIYIAPAFFCRSKDPSLCDCFLLVNPAASKKNIATDMAFLFHKLAKHMGYLGAFSDTFINHTPIINLIYTIGMHVCGSLPQAGNLTGQGWMDNIYFFRDFKEHDSKITLEKDVTSKL